jgi:Zn-dependent peptidase ImmA (M78 family)
MESVRVAGRRYTDPDVISLIKASGGLVDPRWSVIHQAQKLTTNLKRFEGLPNSAIERMTILASMRGISIEAMDVERQRGETRDAILVNTLAGKVILYNPKRPLGRVAFSIGHEITHTFFPSSVKGSRFRNICESNSREANELERLCDLGASELLMPLDDFRAAADGNYSLSNAEKLATVFGSSFEATVYRLATAHPSFAVSGLLRYRQRKDEERKARKLERQSLLFEGIVNAGISSPPKYRRQSCYLSKQCSDDFNVRWNKSFDVSSVVYAAATDNRIHAGIEILPNNSGVSGRIEAVCAPYQRDDAHSEFPDILFFWS